ncbi:RecF/RecN/SMC N terminal domain-containing protein [Theileria equi strain WA]|uniref:Structural maintenance of chromosomes protein 5 n=1 Tax=Theileria equi strain WA TaxID=1537102 RepID=L0B1Q5_THEEQ|nr:RecF/RecN/SMC N terminal domain-containing protein [Theileria equi strain WA]AFZ81403.1 RecF/RecN/SMC N terminal domain-containing protein [Theileria equi strain WA]|eukprot:XP_004831069.1 RecF/RecN/SMC N terminal domain-containing protein [Theileria equi strain WA]
MVSLRDGAIKYISMENWMAYTGPVILNAQPGVNIIAAANGSGKSAIVCAIALSLGFDVSILSRGDNIRSFVKRGSTKAVLKIGIVDNASANGIIHIKRRISLSESISKNKSSESGNKSEGTTVKHNTNVKNEWFIDDKPVTLDYIKSLHMKLNIQVNNLLTFLAQANVGKFAAMNQHELFRSTLKAVDPQLYTDLDLLIDLTNQLKSRTSKSQLIEQELNSCNIKLSELNAINDSMIKLREAQLYSSITKLRLHKIKVSNLNKGLATTKKNIADYNGYISRDEGELKMLQRKFDKTKKEANNLLEHAKDRMRSATELNDLNSTVTVNGEPHKVFEEPNNNVIDKIYFQSITNLKKLLSDFKSEVSRRKISEDNVDKLKEKLEFLNKEIASIRSTMVSTNELVDKIAECKITEESLRYRLQKFNSKQTKSFSETQLDSLLKRLPYTKREHFNLYIKHCQKHNITPQNIVINDLKVNGKLNCCIVEESLGKYLECFILDNTDYNANISLLKDFRLPMITIPEVEHILCNVTPKMKEFGVVAFLHEIIDSSSITKQVLSSVAQINESFIVDGRKLNINNKNEGFYTRFYKIMIEEISYQLGRPINTLKYYIGNKKHIYKLIQGNDDLYTDTETTINQPKILIDYSNYQNCGNDREDVEKIQIELNRITDQLYSLNKQLNEQNNANKHISRKLYALTRQQISVEKSLKSLFPTSESQKDRNWRTELKETKMKQIEFINKAISIKTDIIMKWLEKSSDIRNNLYEANRTYKLYLNSEIELKQIQDALNTSTDALKLLKTKLETLQNTQKEQEERISFYNDSIRELENSIKSSKLSNPVDGSQRKSTAEIIKEFATKINHLNEGELEKELIRAENQVKQLESDDCEQSQIIKKINEGEMLKMKLIQDLKDIKQSIEATNMERNAKFSDWSTEIKSLVKEIDTKFGRYMEYIGDGSAGQVRLDIDLDNIKESKIRILVKFSREKDLLPLTTSYQSGGERGVTTMVYILAVQYITKNAFFVIDEINQGLDSHYERKLMTLLLDDAIDFREEVSYDSKKAKLGSPQYFILTPQLIPGIDLRKATLHFPLNGSGIGSDLTVLWY